MKVFMGVDVNRWYGGVKFKFFLYMRDNECN